MLFKTTLFTAALCAVSTAAQAHGSRPAAFPDYDVYADCDYAAAQSTQKFTTAAHAECLATLEVTKGAAHALFQTSAESTRAACLQNARDVSEETGHPLSYSVLKACLGR